MTMTNKALTDAQRVVLSHASMQADGAVLPLPRSTRLNSGAVGVLLNSLLKQAFVRERPAGRDDISWREVDGGNRVTLVISDEGCEAIGVDVIGTGPARDIDQLAPQLPAPVTVSAPPSLSPASVAEPKAGTKLAMLIEALSQPSGATIEDLIVATGWQAHSIRGAMSGALKKDRGLIVTSEKLEQRGRVYRLPGAASKIVEASPHLRL
jgi:hypothetical protein